jgi:hypothetical protein
MAVGRCAAMPNTDAPRNAPWARTAVRLRPRNSAIACSGVPRNPGMRISAIAPSGLRT